MIGVVRRAAQIAPAAPAQLVCGLAGITVDRSIRSASELALEPTASGLLEAHLRMLLPALARVFLVGPLSLSRVSALRYSIGDFFAPHQDAGPGSPTQIEKRVCTIVVFLSDSANSGLVGGDLVVDADPVGVGTGHGVRIPPLTGRLVAFPSERVHEVTEIREGVRLSAVGWCHRG
jgi:predicted 2-oxoglutarate/Fe(II)-dependent dioxygenase YbiX